MSFLWNWNTNELPEPEMINNEELVNDDDLVKVEVIDESSSENTNDLSDDEASEEIVVKRVNRITNKTIIVSAIAMAVFLYGLLSIMVEMLRFVEIFLIC